MTYTMFTITSLAYSAALKELNTAFADYLKDSRNIEMKALYEEKKAQFDLVSKVYHEELNKLLADVDEVLNDENTKAE